MNVPYNPNPQRNTVGDCTVRAISKAMGQTWYETYWGMCLQGALMCNMPTANEVWGAYLRKHGFIRRIIPDTLPPGYTIADFAADHPKGTYILALSGHVVCAKDGEYFDTWDSGDEVPLYYWERKC